MHGSGWRMTLALASLLTLSGTAAGEPADALFDSQMLHEVRLYMHSRDLRELRARYQENVYYTADLQWGGVRVRNVGVRARGSASRSATKPGLRIDFDRYVTGQRFLGLRALVLDNLWQDASMLREALVMALFRRVGQPAPRVSFCRLFINNVPHGVYAIVEAVEPEFLKRAFGEDDGFLFEYHHVGEYYGEDLGEDHEPYKRRFEARTHRLEPDAILYGPIRDLLREVNRPMDAVWREQVARYLDLDAFVTYIAIETFVSEYDGVLGRVGMNNFYLYRPADGTAHRFIPWDKDLAVEYIDYPILDPIDTNALSRGVFAFADLAARYADVLRLCAEAALDEGWLAAEVQRLASVVGPAARADSAKRFSNEEFEAAVLWLDRFASERPAFVLEALAKTVIPRR